MTAAGLLSRSSCGRCTDAQAAELAFHRIWPENSGVFFGLHRQRSYREGNVPDDRSGKSLIVCVMAFPRWTVETEQRVEHGPLLFSAIQIRRASVRIRYRSLSRLGVACNWRVPQSFFFGSRLITRRASDFIERSKATNRVRAYRADWNALVGWCRRCGRARCRRSNEGMALYLADIGRSAKWQL